MCEAQSEDCLTGISDFHIFLKDDNTVQLEPLLAVRVT